MSNAVATYNSVNKLTRAAAPAKAEARALDAMWLETKVTAAKGSIGQIEILGEAAAQLARDGAPHANVYALMVEYLRGAVRSRLDAGT